MINKKIYTVLGIMTGTSMDGLDCSLIKTNGKNYCKILEEYSYNYSLKYKRNLIKIINNLPKYKNEQLEYAKKYDKFITNEILKKIMKFLNKIDHKIDFIGLSGQTIFHNPKRKYSLQLGSAKKIFKKIKIPIVSNFRENDLFNGGQGAPIGCYYHKLLIKKINKKAVIINIGGISNITFLYKNKLIGYDLGPGNALIDDLIYHYYKKNFDRNGNYAKKGNLIKKNINNFKKNEYFKKKYPKSLDRNYFNYIFDDLKLLKANDAIHTASIMTIYSILKGLDLVNKKINEIILTGGGRKNKFIFNELNIKLNKKGIALNCIDKYGFDGDMIEAQMFGFLAIRHIKKLNISTPTTTGVKKSISGGILYKNYE